MAPAVKFPDASLATIALAVFALAAVVAELETFPEVEIVASLVSAIAAVAETLLLSIAPAAISGVVAVPAISPASCILPVADGPESRRLGR